MTLEQANKLITGCMEKMRAEYGKPVFDEWAVISLANNKGHIFNYVGPRKDGFRDNFQSDTGALLEGLLKGDYTPGDFEFARHGIGTGFESFLVLGPGIYLICNNTAQSMDEITKDPKWLAAQVPFVEMSEKFSADAVQ
jgi:hypothetical protein